MRFPVSVKPFRGQLDVAAFTGVLMLLVLFVMLASLVYTPGVRLELPVAADLPGTDRPTVAVAVDALGRFYYHNQLIGGAELQARLREAATRTAQPPTLVVHADRRASHDMLVGLTLLAREAGIQDVLLATLPAPTASPAGPPRP